jgi:hypothetical protein
MLALVHLHGKTERAEVRGMIVILRTGADPGWLAAASAWPTSW